MHCYGTHKNLSQHFDHRQREIHPTRQTSRKGHLVQNLWDVSEIRLCAGKYTGTHHRQPVYTFGHSRRDQVDSSRNLGPGAHLPI